MPSIKHNYEMIRHTTAAAWLGSKWASRLETLRQQSPDAEHAAAKQMRAAGVPVEIALRVLCEKNRS